jgi:hypothetical protein
MVIVFEDEYTNLLNIWNELPSRKQRGIKSGNLFSFVANDGELTQAPQHLSQ